MKKSVKRFLCGTLSLMMASTLVAEQVFRSYADESYAQTVITNAAFKDVTGQFDTSAIREANFNDKVQKAEDIAPTYETRTVMVTLQGDSLADAADGMPVREFVDTFTGNNVSLNCVIADKNVVIRDGRMLSGHESMPFFIPKGSMV